MPLAAAAAVAAVIAGAVAVPHLLRSASPAPVTLSPVPGAPPFVVLQPYSGGSAVSRLVVQAAGTRHVLGFVSAPRGTRWESVAATGSSTIFVAAAGSSGRDCAVRLYTLTLTANGKPAGLEPLRALRIPGRLTGLAASSDGRTVAYGSVPCTAVRASATIGVIADGALRQWTLPPETSPGSVSLSADGSELGYVGLPPGGTTLTRPLAAAAAWILPASSPPGSALARSRKVFAARDRLDLVSAILSGDGRTMYVASESPSRLPGRLTLAAYRTADGALLRTLHTWDHAQGYEPGMAVGGNQLLIWAIYQPSTFQVDLATGRAKPFWVYTPAGEFPEALAW